MASKEKRQVVVIGAGPGGYAAAFRAADLGLKVTLIDPEVNPGGVCLYRGCIPSKALLHVAKVKQEAVKAAALGVQFEDPKIEPQKIFEWKNEVVKKMTQGLGELADVRKIEYIQGKAVFTSEKELEVLENEGKKYTLEFESAIIATGSLVAELPGVKVDHNLVIDSSDALDITEIPENMLVIGGGYIGLEMGSVYAALGSSVSIVEMTPGFLPGADRDLVEVFQEENEDLFENLYFETIVEKVTEENGKAKVGLKNSEGVQEKEYDKVLLAVGRKPNSAHLNLDKAGVETNEKGFVKVDEKRQTSTANIYAIGDLTSQPMLAHKAHHEGRIAAEVIAGEKGAAYDPKVIPAIVFTNPEIAWCGLTETQAKEKGREVKVATFPWTSSGKAASMGTRKGLTKLIFDPDTQRILGGGVAGKSAGSLIPEIALAIEMAATAHDVSLTIHPHPTLSETTMEAAESFLGSPTHLFGK
ncbi:dihydrolipoyl dehydrogenase [Pontibacter korlensis]|uniref:Dihydrolipoyl dehydrogenase n=1 Tax=Pontibacter korlensis TaxID=400092 RepID=A0A0E3UYP6_9BACT|nr:dihydrolipoyl dehydrogenase [Pontibacter korlensis]AKD05327.1 dihydrolipoamide dehydrogenase [Pontibacter korlensis]